MFCRIQLATVLLNYSKSNSVILKLRVLIKVLAFSCQSDGGTFQSILLLLTLKQSINGRRGQMSTSLWLQAAEYPRRSKPLREESSAVTRQDLAVSHGRSDLRRRNRCRTISWLACSLLNSENLLLSQAYIRIGSSRCGGTLVNRFHVVTAGHCVAKWVENRRKSTFTLFPASETNTVHFFTRASARQVQVTLGDYVVNSASESLPAYTFGVREIRVHPYFKFTPQADR